MNTTSNGSNTPFNLDLFADKNLKLCVKETGAECIEELIELNCDGAAIKNLNGIEQLTALNELILESNFTIDISQLSYLGALKKLILNKNIDINDISALSNLNKLTSLSAVACSITDISALHNLAAMKELNINYNNISDIISLKKRNDFLHEHRIRSCRSVDSRSSDGLNEIMGDT